MHDNAKRNYLYLLVFTAGFASLGVEMAASRLMDPWFGNSQLVWASLIGLVLLYLAVGYWLGGRIADRWPSLETLLRLAALAGLGVGLVPAVSHPVLQMASLGLADFDAGLLAGSLMAVLMLFSVPVTLLGCISPFAVRLAIRDIPSSGRVAGRVYALSTIGSIFGSFLPVLLLVPYFGTRATFAILAVSMLLVAMVGFGISRRRLDLAAAALATILVVWLGARSAGNIKATTGLLYEKESMFNYIQVVDAGFERQLRLNEGKGIHSVYRPQGGLADGIWDYFLLAPAFNPAPYGPDRVRSVCLLGLAGGTVAQLYSEAYGPVLIDGVELDPDIISAGREWFNMNQPNLTAIAADGRRYLAGTHRVYDVIAIDAYRPPYIPFHLTTVEFFATVRDRLAPEGVVAINVGRTRTDARLVHALSATLQQVFPSVYVIDEPDEGSTLASSLVVATRGQTTLADMHANLPAFSNPLVAKVAARAAPLARPAQPPSGTPIFSDDRAPLELVVHQLILAQALAQD